MNSLTTHYRRSQLIALPVSDRTPGSFDWLHGTQSQ